MVNELRQASRIMASLAPDRRAAIVNGLADSIDAGGAMVLMMNRKDREADSATDATEISPGELQDCLAWLRRILDDADPLDGRSPVGVAAVLHEGSPLDTVKAAAMALTCGNACLVWGGTHAPETNGTIGKFVEAVLRGTGAPVGACRILHRASRAQAELAAAGADLVVTGAPTPGALSTPALYAVKPDRRNTNSDGE